MNAFSVAVNNLTAQLTPCENVLGVESLKAETFCLPTRTSSFRNFSNYFVIVIYESEIKGEVERMCMYRITNYGGLFSHDNIEKLFEFHPGYEDTHYYLDEFYFMYLKPVPKRHVCYTFSYEKFQDRMTNDIKNFIDNAQIPKSTHPVDIKEMLFKKIQPKYESCPFWKLLSPPPPVPKPTNKTFRMLTYKNDDFDNPNEVLCRIKDLSINFGLDFNYYEFHYDFHKTFNAICNAYNILISI